MRGRKVDKNFIFNFIKDNLKEDNIQFITLIEKVNGEISEIDNQIKKIEELKVKRCKLIQVKEFLEKNGI